MSTTVFKKLRVKELPVINNSQKMISADANGNFGYADLVIFGNIDGGSANSIELASQNIDGGSATSIDNGIIDGGNAFN